MADYSKIAADANAIVTAGLVADTATVAAIIAGSANPQMLAMALASLAIVSVEQLAAERDVDAQVLWQRLTLVYAQADA